LTSCGCRSTAIPPLRLCPSENLVDARVIECDVLVVGGGTGGVCCSPRRRRAEAGTSISWRKRTGIGGQLTAQGVSALDEHEYIEDFGGTASYYRLRNALRDHYRPHAGRSWQAPTLQPGQLLGDPCCVRTEGSPWTQ